MVHLRLTSNHRTDHHHQLRILRQQSLLGWICPAHARSTDGDGVLQRRDSLLMCRPWIIVISIATNSFGSAFSINSEGTLCHKKRRYNELLVLSSSSSSNKSERDVEFAVVEWDNLSDLSNERGFQAQKFASSNCWGCRPFLFRGAFDPALLLDRCQEDINRDGATIYAWPSWEDVVEIAADVDSESRIISHVPNDHSSFELSWGPLTGKDMRAWLSKHKSSNTEKQRRETLVVNDIDRFYPPLADWIFDTFRFIPNWRMDDGQISLSEEGGGIGPHVDNYDVFLIQMSGTRTWQIGRRKISAHEERDRMIDGLDVRVLSGWSLKDGSEQEMEEWTVYPGDLLYLPPRVAHCGTSLSDDCVTLSVGCRAPSVSDLVSKLAEKLSSSLEDYSVLRYTDAGILKDDNSGYSPGELTLDAKVHAKQLVMDSLTSIINDDEWWDEFLGRYVTEQKRVRNNYPVPLETLLVDGESGDEGVCDEWADARSAVQNVLAGNGALYQAEGIAFAYSSVDSKRQYGRTIHRFFVNGDIWQSESQSNDMKQSSIVRIFKIVANHRLLDRLLLLGLDDSDVPDRKNDVLSSEAIAFLEELVSAGILYGSDLL